MTLRARERGCKLLGGGGILEEGAPGGGGVGGEGHPPQSQQLLRGPEGRGGAVRRGGPGEGGARDTFPVCKCSPMESVENWSRHRFWEQQTVERGLYKFGILYVVPNWIQTLAKIMAFNREEEKEQEEDK